MTTITKTFGQLTVGTVINFYRSTTADDTNYVVYRIVNNFRRFIYTYLDTITAKANAALQERRKTYDVNETKRMKRQKEIEKQIKDYEDKLDKGEEPEEGISLSRWDILGRNDVP